MAKYIAIERPNGMVTLVRSIIETASEYPLTEHEEIINELYSKVKNLNIPAVMGELTCDSCGCHPNVIYTTSKGRFCERCKPAS